MLDLCLFDRSTVAQRATPQGRARTGVRFAPALLAAVLLAAALTGCGGDNQAGAGPAAAKGAGGAPAAGGPGKPGGGPGGPGGGMPQPEVGVVTVQLGEVGLVTELPGRLEASRVAQVRARAAGIVQKRLFKEGSAVKAGQPLFTIDSAPYQATLLSAKAQLTRAEANAAEAASLVKRYRPLVQANAISKQEYANAVAAQKTTEADVAVGRAAVQTAQINVGYASVTSPISGPHRPCAGDRGCVGRPGARRRRWRWCSRSIRCSSISRSRPPSRCGCAVRSRTASCSARATATRRRCRSCWKTAASFRSRASCCSPT